MLTVAKHSNVEELQNNDGVIVVSVQLTGSEQALQKMSACLAPEELARASRYRFDKDRRSFIASRAALRVCLAHFTATAPQDVKFEYSAEGKPLHSAQTAINIQFNLSHTEGLAAIAIARSRRVGIDVEQAARVIDEVEIAEKYFSAAESAHLRKLSEADRRRAFLSCWTRKEAYAKATGRGLSSVLERPHKDEPIDQDFTFLPLLFEGDYVGVVAVEGIAKLAQHLHFTSIDDFLTAM